MPRCAVIFVASSGAEPSPLHPNFLSAPTPDLRARFSSSRSRDTALGDSDPVSRGHRAPLLRRRTRDAVAAAPPGGGRQAGLSPGGFSSDGRLGVQGGHRTGVLAQVPHAHPRAVPALPVEKHTHAALVVLHLDQELGALGDRFRIVHYAVGRRLHDKEQLLNHVLAHHIVEDRLQEGVAADGQLQLVPVPHHHSALL
uniref:Putative secreted protein n=1 Tax=Ixodes ricinus TaxID=34613 RepID=A0A6B0V127_IXORI